ERLGGSGGRGRALGRAVRHLAGGGGTGAGAPGLPPLAEPRLRALHRESLWRVGPWGEGSTPALDRRDAARGRAAAQGRRAHGARGGRLSAPRSVADPRAAPHGALRRGARALLLDPADGHAVFP